MTDEMKMMCNDEKVSKKQKSKIYESLPSEEFLATQVPDMEIVYHSLPSGEHPNWLLTLQYYLKCHKDYSKELKSVLSPEHWKELSEDIKQVINHFVARGELVGLAPDRYRPLTVDKRLLTNRITANLYRAYQDGKLVPGKGKQLVQSYSSPYCMLLSPKEERAVCAIYHIVSKEHKNKCTENISRDAVLSLAFTFLCPRLRKIYATFENALRASNTIDDGMNAVVLGLSIAMDEEYDFSAAPDVGLGPGRLNIPIIREIKSAIHSASDFAISDATWRKIYSYDEEKHGEMTREELMKEFKAAPATVDMMLLYGRGGLVSLDSVINSSENEDKHQIVGVDMLGVEEEAFFLCEMEETINKVLDDDQRQIFNYVYYDELKYKEIAALMGIPERKVKYLFDLCRKKLQPIFSEKVKRCGNGYR